MIWDVGCSIPPSMGVDVMCVIRDAEDVMDDQRLMRYS